MSDVQGRFDVSANVGNHFAWLRTMIALQRTLMASVRTSVSLIGFGFTVAQFFQRMQDMEGMQGMNAELPRNLGLVLIAAGVVSLAIFTWQYRAASDYLRGDTFKEIMLVAKRKHMHTSTYLTAFAVMLIGIAAFGSVFIHF
jgi:putative membrane protein